LRFDPAKITDQIAKYTGLQFGDFAIDEVVRANGRFPALLIWPTRLPIIFTRVGTYEVVHGHQKNAFSKGALYFRHGAKSEPATQDDIRDAFYRELCRVCEEWLGNVRRVTEASPGAELVISEHSEATTSVRLTNDMEAPAVRVRDLSETHPYRQKEVIREVRRRQARPIRFNSHDIQAVKFAEKLRQSTHPDLIHKPHSAAAPQYSLAFIDLICHKIAANDNYLEKCRTAWKVNKYGR
ncbi:MAG: hypothetical protein AAFY31_09730, partial [Pseudomonadota bacterium]